MLSPMPVSYFRVNIQGTFTSGDTWSINPAFDYVDPPAATIPTQALLNTWAAAILELNGGDFWPDVLASVVSAQTSVTAVRVGWYGAGGDLSIVAEATPDAPIAGVTTASLPADVALVATLLTGVPGRRTRGRLYIPALGVNIQTPELRVNTGSLAGFANGVAVLLTDIAEAAGALGPLGAVVVSQVGSLATPVTSVRVGDVYDTQRRRQNSLIENTASWPYPVA